MMHFGARLVRTVLLVFGISLATFAMMRAAGSDVVTQRMQNSGMIMTEEATQVIRHELGLDQPFAVQYLSWLWSMMRGDFGKSYLSGEDVSDMFISKLPATLLLASLSLFLTIAASIPLGFYAAVHRGSPGDLTIRALSFLTGSMPNFLTALLLIYFLSVKFRLLPSASFDVSLKGAFMPSATLAVAMTSKYVRQVRAAVLEEIRKEYVTAAVARGVPFKTILRRSIFKACAPGLLTLFALSAGSLLGGTAVVESIFMWDGVGQMAVSAINMRDYPVVQAYVIWMALTYTGLNLAAEALCCIADPRSSRRQA